MSTSLSIIRRGDREGSAPTEPSTDRTCAECGYGNAIHEPPPARPMCGGTRWMLRHGARRAA